MRGFRQICLLLLLVSVDGCVERLDIEKLAQPSRIVVDGQITDQDGPHRVRIFFSNGEGKLLPVTNANVSVVDDDGITTPLISQVPGEYETPEDFRGVPGRSYKLQFTTGNDRSYESTFQKIHPAGRITGIYKEFDARAFQTDKPSEIGEGYRFYIDSEGEEGALNLFRWRARTTFEVEAYPHLHVKYILPPGSDSLVRVPDPLECGGMALDSFGVLRPVAECTCCSCWLDEYAERAQVSDNRFISQREFAGILIAKTRIDPLRFQRRYYLRVEQLSLTEDVYSFWKKVQDQQESNANIFQPGTIHIRGNISCITDPEEDVSGIFSASAVVSQGIFVERKEIPVSFEVSRPANDCRIAFPGSTNQKPPFW